MEKTQVKDLIEGCYYTIERKGQPIVYRFNGFDMGKRPVFVSDRGLWSFHKNLTEIPVKLLA